MPLADNPALFYSLFTATFVSCAIIVAATWRSKALRSPCNLLIAFESAIYALVQPICYAPFLVVQPPQFGGPTMRFADCFWVLAGPVLLFEMGLIMPASIALERLLSVLFPVWAQHRSPLRFALLMTVPVFLWAFGTLLWFGVTIYTQTPDLQVSCTPIALYSTPMGVWVNFAKLWLIPLCWGCYAAIWLVLKQRNSVAPQIPVLVVVPLQTISNNGLTAVNSPIQGVGHHHQHQEAFKRLTRSLVVVITLINFELVAPLLITYARTIFHIPDELWVTTCVPIARIMKEAAVLLTTPALYVLSTEYNVAIRELFAWMLHWPLFRCMKRGGAAVAPIAPMLYHASYRVPPS